VRLPAAGGGVLQETSILAGCRSPFITRYMGSFIPGGSSQLLIVMELLVGSVADAVSHRGPGGWRTGGGQERRRGPRRPAAHSTLAGQRAGPVTGQGAGWCSMTWQQRANWPESRTWQCTGGASLGCASRPREAPTAEPAVAASRVMLGSTPARAEGRRRLQRGNLRSSSSTPQAPATSAAVVCTQQQPTSSATLSTRSCAGVVTECCCVLLLLLLALLPAAPAAAAGGQLALAPLDEPCIQLRILSRVLGALCYLHSAADACTGTRGGGDCQRRNACTGSPGRGDWDRAGRLHRGQVPGEGGTHSAGRLTGTRGGGTARRPATAPPQRPPHTTHTAPASRPARCCRLPRHGSDDDAAGRRRRGGPGRTPRGVEPRRPEDVPEGHHGGKPDARRGRRRRPTLLTPPHTHTEKTAPAALEPGPPGPGRHPAPTTPRLPNRPTRPPPVPNPKPQPHTLPAPQTSARPGGSTQPEPTQPLLNHKNLPPKP